MPPSALIEKYMPRFDVRERHEAVVEAEPSRTYAALRALDVNRSLLVRIIFAIRTLPARLSSAPPPPKGQSCWKPRSPRASSFSRKRRARSSSRAP